MAPQSAVVQPLPLPDGAPRAIQPIDRNSVVQIHDSPNVTPKQSRSVVEGALLESVDPDGLEPSVQQLGLGADTPSLPSPGCLTPLRSCRSTIPYTASPVPVEHLSMRNERMHNGVITNTPKLDSNPLLRSYPRP